jgi:hypothetical protein
MTNEIDIEALEKFLKELPYDPLTEITGLEDIVERDDPEFYNMTPQKFAIMKDEAEDLLDQFCRQNMKSSPELMFAVEAFYIRWEFYRLDANGKPVLVLKPDKSN